jgi:hypothetical protein
MFSSADDVGKTVYLMKRNKMNYRFKPYTKPIQNIIKI